MAAGLLAVLRFGFTEAALSGWLYVLIRGLRQLFFGRGL